MIMRSANCRHATTALVYILISIAAFAGTVAADDYTMESNLNEIADQMARWSMQCGTKEMTPESQAKLSELLQETSKLLKQIAANTGSEMQQKHHQEDGKE